MRPSREMDKLLNELAVYRTELAKGTHAQQYHRIKAIIEALPDVNRTTDRNGVTYLMAAVMQHKADIVKLLLECGADPNQGRLDGVRPLAAVFLKRTAQQEEIVRLLIAAGADPSLTDRPGQSAFDFAQITQAEPALITLLEKANFRLHGIPRKTPSIN